MKIANSFVSASLMFVLGMWATPVPAQDSNAPAAVTDPLNNYTLDALIPVRPAEQTSAQLAIAQSWLEMSNNYRERARGAKELVKARLSTKDAEVTALESRIKEAKTAGDKVEAERIKQDVKAQKDQLNALKKIQAYSGEFDDLANAMEDAAKKWIAFLETENEVAQARLQAAKRTTSDDGSFTPVSPTKADFKTHKQFLAAAEEYAKAMEKYGKALQQLANSSSKVMSDWEERNLTK